MKRSAMYIAYSMILVKFQHENLRFEAGLSNAAINSLDRELFRPLLQCHAKDPSNTRIRRLSKSLSHDSICMAVEERSES